jgi:hypothetical protein
MAELKYQILVDVTEQKYIKMALKCIQGILMVKVFSLTIGMNKRLLMQ